MASTDHQPPGRLDPGNARESTTKQSPERQVDALAAAGIPAARTYADNRTGAATDRPGPAEALRHARAGDTIAVHTLDRIGRNPREVLNLVQDLAGRGIGVQSLADPLPVNTADEGPRRIAFLLLALFAGMERTLTRRTRRPRPGSRRSREPAHRPPPRPRCRQDRIRSATEGPGPDPRRDHRQDRHPEDLAAPLSRHRPDHSGGVMSQSPPVDDCLPARPKAGDQ